MLDSTGESILEHSSAGFSLSAGKRLPPVSLLRIPPAKLCNDFSFNYRKVTGSRGSALLLIPLAFTRRYMCIGWCFTDALPLLVCKVSLKRSALIAIPATKYSSRIIFTSDHILVCLLYLSPKCINRKISE